MGTYISIKVLEVKDNQVKVGIHAPSFLHRGEVDV
ncbi:carbon storage regulator [Microbulbifer sp. CnH-101-E]